MSTTLTDEVRRRGNASQVAAAIERRLALLVEMNAPIKMERKERLARAVDALETIPTAGEK